jgi:hypothetical protein
MMDLVIITSIINCKNKPLSYSMTRSVFNKKIRFEQTLNSIQQIKNKISKSDILVCECSDFTDTKYEEKIKEQVKYYYNFYDDIDIRDAVESIYKGLGEAYIILKAINKMDELIYNYKNIFKLSGRYFLNAKFDYNEYNNKCNCFCKWENNTSYNTIFYKIVGSEIDKYKTALINCIQYLKKGKSMESALFMCFKVNVKTIKVMGIAGFFSASGRYIEF